MNKVLRFAFGFIVAFLLVFAGLFIKSAFSQSLVRTFTKGYDQHGMVTLTDTLPSPANGFGYYIFVYDLGYTQPANKPLRVSVYGQNPAGSHLYLCSVYDDGGVKFSHLQVLSTLTQGDSFGGDVSTVAVRQTVPFRYIALLREAEGTPTVKPTWRPENGLPCVIDSVSAAQLFKQQTQPFIYHFGHTTIQRSAVGYKTISILK